MACWFHDLKIELTAGRILRRHLGLVRAIQVGRQVRKRTKRGQPFAELDPPGSERERMSREQIGPAILLYQELLSLVSQPEAYAITEAVVIVGAVSFLEQSIGRLHRQDLVLLDDIGREDFIKQRGAKFFNATIRWDHISDESIRFTVEACRFPELCRLSGVPELAPAFCQGDAKFFKQSDVELDRPHTIAEGGESCPFSLSWIVHSD